LDHPVQLQVHITVNGLNALNYNGIGNNYRAIYRICSRTNRMLRHTQRRMA